MHSQRAQFGRSHLKNLLDVLIFCSVNFALVISLFKCGGCRLLLIIFDVEIYIVKKIKNLRHIYVLIPTILNNMSTHFTQLIRTDA